MAGGVARSVVVVATGDSGISQDDFDDGETLADDQALSDKIRQNEIRSLTRVDGPTDLFFGRGFGASIDRGPITREMRPWQTELQYLAMYYWTGVIGICLMALTGLLGLLALRKAFRLHDSLTGILVVSSVGALATLIGNASNPYIQAPGHMWPVFLPFMIAGVILGDQSQNAGAEGDERT